MLALQTSIRAQLEDQALIVCLGENHTHHPMDPLVLIYFILLLYSVLASFARCKKWWPVLAAAAMMCVTWCVLVPVFVCFPPFLFWLATFWGRTKFPCPIASRLFGCVFFFFFFLSSLSFARGLRQVAHSQVHGRLLGRGGRGLVGCCVRRCGAHPCGLALELPALVLGGSGERVVPRSAHVVAAVWHVGCHVGSLCHVGASRGRIVTLGARVLPTVCGDGIVLHSHAARLVGVAGHCRVQFLSDALARHAYSATTAD